MALRSAVLICMLAGWCEAWWQGHSQRVVGITGGTDCGMELKPGVSGGTKNRYDPADEFRQGARQAAVGIAGGMLIQAGMGGMLLRSTGRVVGGAGGGGSVVATRGAAERAAP